MLIDYKCPECNVSELLSEIIPKKTCDICGMLMEADEIE